MTTRLPHEIQTLELGTPTASIADPKLASASYHHSDSSPIYSTTTRTQAKANALQQPLVSETGRGLFGRAPLGPPLSFWSNYVRGNDGRCARPATRQRRPVGEVAAADSGSLAVTKTGPPGIKVLAMAARSRACLLSAHARGETLTDEPQQRSSFNPGHQTARLGRRLYQRRPVPSPAARDVGRGRLKGGQRTGADGNDRRACRHGIANRSLEIRRLPLAWPYFLASDSWGAPLRTPGDKTMTSGWFCVNPQIPVA